MDLFKKIKKSNEGFTLIEVVIASGLLCMMALAMMQMNQTAAKSIKHLEYKMAELEFVNLMRLHLIDKDACTNSFVNVNISGRITINRTIRIGGRSVGSFGQNITLVSSGNVNEIKSKTGTVIAKLGEYWPNENQKTFLIKSLKLKKTDDEEYSGSRPVELRMQLERIGNHFSGGRTVEKKLQLMVITDSTGKITSCASASDAEIIPKDKTYIVTKVGNLNKVPCKRNGEEIDGCYEYSASCEEGDQALSGDCMSHAENMNTTVGDLSLSIPDGTSCDECPNSNEEICPLACYSAEYTGFKCRYYGEVNDKSGARIFCLDRTI